MTDEHRLIVDIATKVAPPLLAFLGKEVGKRLMEASPVSKAIVTTSRALAQIEGLDTALRTWCASEEFSAVLNKMKEGRRGLTDSDIVSSFIDAAGFFMGNETQSAAQIVVRRFLKNIEHELYSSSEGTQLLAERIEVQHADMLDRSDVIESGLTNIQMDVQRISSALVLPEDVEGSADVQDIVLNGRVDDARRLIDSGQVEAAEQQLLGIQDDAARSRTTPTLRFRITTNLGACALALDRPEFAAEKFRDALKLQPNNPKALRNAAVAELLEEDWARALDLSGRAQAADPNHREGVDVYLDSLFRLGKLDELDQFLSTNSWIDEEPAYPLVHARICFDRGEVEKAEDLLTRGLENDSAEDPLKHCMLGQFMAGRINKTLGLDPPLPWKVPAEIESALDRAEFHLSRAVRLLEGRQERGRLREALVICAAVRGMRGRYVEGLEDCNRVLSEDPDDTVAIKNKGIVLCWQPAKVGHFETREIRDRERAW